MPGKRALLIGFNYSFLSPQIRLNGCINDVRSMSTLLQSKFGYDKNRVTIITDDDVRSLSRCTNAGVMLAIHELCVASWKEDLDEVYFHYSGHGSRIKDGTGDEKDGMDEGIVPFDFQRTGILIDDHLLTLFRNFNPKTKVICIFDCCNSGSILDLKYVYDANKQSQEKAPEDPSAPFILLFSGCRDDQVSLDVMETTGASGALTSTITKLLRDKPALSALDLQNEVNAAMTVRKFAQVCMLSCSRNLSVEQMKGTKVFS